MVVKRGIVGMCSDPAVLGLRLADSVPLAERYFF